MILTKAKNQAGSDDPLFMPELQTVCRPIIVQLQSEMSLGTAFSLGVTSSSRGDGRSTLALGLAAAGANQLGTQARVLVIDADIENPMLHLRCKVPQSPGLFEVMSQQVPMT